MVASRDRRDLPEYPDTLSPTDEHRLEAGDSTLRSFTNIEEGTESGLDTPFCCWPVRWWLIGVGFYWILNACWIIGTGAWAKNYHGGNGVFFTSLLVFLVVLIGSCMILFGASLKNTRLLRISYFFMLFIIAVVIICFLIIIILICVSNVFYYIGSMLAAYVMCIATSIFVAFLLRTAASS